MKQETVLITGAAQRLGRAMALAVAERGCRVAVHYHTSAAPAEALAADIRAAGGEAVAVAADLGDAEAVAGLVEAAAQALGPVTVLVNNASAFANDDVGSLTAKGWRRHLTVNAEAPVFLARAMAAALPVASDGLVVNMLDEAVLRPGPTFFSYTVSKAALAAATEMLAQALAPRTRVNGIAPGLILNSGHPTEDAFERAHRNTLLGRGPGADAIVRALLYLMEADTVTGQILYVDAGKHLMQNHKYLPASGS
ncbi:MAG: SDR family oxidoreductase [Alphaproteobacteria bacterium]|nr:SDR family oxidoreductase [Alphaproteobacteria bacterium]MCB9929852.1 SDR family oxidoreductase [Alphaproteobacteria bacterium]